MNLFFFVFLFLATRDTVGGPWRHRHHVLATCRPQLKTPLIICMNFFGPPATPLTALGDIVNMLPQGLILGRAMGQLAHKAEIGPLFFHIAGRLAHTFFPVGLGIVCPWPWWS